MRWTPWIRSGLWAVGATVVAAVVVVATGLELAEHKAMRQVRIAVQPVALPTDDAALARGHYLYASRGCADCHGIDGAGRRFVDGGPGMQLAGPAIAPGAAGAPTATTGYTAEDWVRTVRHGVKPDGRPLRVMPSEDYNRLTDADLGALVAYVQSMPPVPPRAATLHLPLPARVLYGFGQIPDAVDKIDHGLPPSAPVAEAVTPEHGRYVAAMCQGCHGSTLAGGRIAGAPPDWPAAAPLVGAGSVMATAYAEPEAFLRMLKTGRRADGSAVAVMPFEALSQLSDTDARALHLYLRQGAATATATATAGHSHMLLSAR
jgi:mono/diheme cytochrome c family protein